LEECSFRNHERARVEITDQAGLTIEFHPFPADRAADRAIDVDIHAFDLGVDFTGRVDPQVAGTEEFPLEEAIDPDAFFGFQGPLNERAGTDKSIERFSPDLRSFFLFPNIDR